MDIAFVPNIREPAWSETPMAPAGLPCGLPAIRPGIISAWRARTRFRLDLKRMLRDNPHLIDDIGLTRQQVEAEIAKLPFWQR
jgi:uncharacterized protein YjiS (DUF1127 family)